MPLSSVKVLPLSVTVTGSVVVDLAMTGAASAAMAERKMQSAECRVQNAHRPVRAGNEAFIVARGLNGGLDGVESGKPGMVQIYQAEFVNQLTTRPEIGEAPFIRKPGSGKATRFSTFPGKKLG